MRSCVHLGGNDRWVGEEKRREGRDECCKGRRVKTY